MLFWFHCQNNITKKRKLVNFWIKRRFCSCSKQHKYRKSVKKRVSGENLLIFYVINRWVVLFWIQKWKNPKIENFAVMGFWDAAHEIHVLCSYIMCLCIFSVIYIRACTGIFLMVITKFLKPKFSFTMKIKN